MTSALKLLPLLLLTLCISASQRQAIAQQNDEFITNEFVRSFFQEHLPWHWENFLLPALRENDQENVDSLMYQARNMINQNRYLRGRSGPEIAAVGLKVLEMHAQLNSLAYGYGQATDTRIKDGIEEEIKAVLRKSIPEQLKLDKAELAAQKRDVKQFEKTIEAQEENPEAFFDWRLQFTLGKAPGPFAPAAPARSLVRTWTSATGTTVEAELVGLQGDAVVLKRRDGKPFTVPIDKLSDKDQAWIRSRNDTDPFRESDPFNE